MRIPLAVRVLATGRYAEPSYDVVLGMDRGALRVATCTAVMADRFPPLRLDQGGFLPWPPMPAVRRPDPHDQGRPWRRSPRCDPVLRRPSRSALRRHERFRKSLPAVVPRP
ncbi:hypothetical protein [Blastococcus sp. SYSU D00695]